MKAIAAADCRWAIGNKGNLLVHIPEDLENFRALTAGKTVVYGRRTMETFPGGKPLQGRRNIILTRNPRFEAENAVIVHSIDELLRILPDNTDDVWVIGGGMVYSELLPYCDTAVITRVEAEFAADAWFPDLDSSPEWQCTERGENRMYEGLVYHYDIYERSEQHR